MLLLQKILKVVVLESDPVWKVPEVFLTPAHPVVPPPLALQNVALEEDQLRKLDPPKFTLVGLAERLTVGFWAGGGLLLHEPETLTCTEAVATVLLEELLPCMVYVVV